MILSSVRLGSGTAGVPGIDTGCKLHGVLSILKVHGENLIVAGSSAGQGKIVDVNGTISRVKRLRREEASAGASFNWPEEDVFSTPEGVALTVLTDVSPTLSTGRASL